MEAAWANGYTGRNFRDSRDGAAIRLQAGTGGRFLDRRHRRHPFERRQQVPLGRLLLRRADMAEHLRGAERLGLQDRHQLPPDRQGPVRAGRSRAGNSSTARLGNETYTNKADTYGLMLSLDRRDIINDDLGAITTVPRKLGRGSGLKINDIFWTTFLNNAAFFAAGNKNYLAGADTALGIDGLRRPRSRSWTLPTATASRSASCPRSCWCPRP